MGKGPSLTAPRVTLKDCRSEARLYPFDPLTCVRADKRPVDSSHVSGEIDVGLTCVTKGHPTSTSLRSIERGEARYHQTGHDC